MNILINEKIIKIEKIKGLSSYLIKMHKVSIKINIWMKVELLIKECKKKKSWLKRCTNYHNYQKISSLRRSSLNLIFLYLTLFTNKYIVYNMFYHEVYIKEFKYKDKCKIRISGIVLFKLLKLHSWINLLQPLDKIFIHFFKIIINQFFFEKLKFFQFFQFLFCNIQSLLHNFIGFCSPSFKPVFQFFNRWRKHEEKVAFKTTAEHLLCSLNFNF